MKNFLRLASIIGTLPNNLTNGTTADATQVMADLNKIVNDVNANAAPLANIALTNVSNNFTAVQYGVAATGAAAFPIASQLQGTPLSTLGSVAGSNAITANALSFPLSAYQTGQMFTFYPSQANAPGAATLNIDGLGAKPILSMGSASMGLEMSSSVPTTVHYDGASFNIVNRQPGRILVDRKVAQLTSTIIFTSISSMFDEYILCVTDLAPTTDMTALRFDYSKDGGVTFNAVTHNYVSFGAVSGAQFTISTNNSYSEMSGPTGLSSSAISTFNGTLHMFTPSNPTMSHGFRGEWQFVAAGGSGNTGTMLSATRAAQPGTFGSINALRLQMNSGQMRTGNFAFYGLRKS